LTRAPPERILISLIRTLQLLEHRQVCHSIDKVVTDLLFSEIDKMIVE
jgi:hypothetical protein